MIVALKAHVLKAKKAPFLELTFAQVDAVLLTTATWLVTLMVVTVRASQRISSLQALIEVVPYQYVAEDRELTEVAISVTIC